MSKCVECRHKEVCKYKEECEKFDQTPSPMMFLISACKLEWGCKYFEADNTIDDNTIIKGAE